MKKTEMKKFWLVWNSKGNAPRVQHSSREFAENEAARLARENPGQNFIVLKAVGGSGSSPAKLRNIKFVNIGRDGPPFAPEVRA